MYPDDRVLVGVINRKKDLDIARERGWYRIPQEKLPRGVYFEYLAFFVSGYPASKLGTSGVHYFAPRTGVELCYRRDLLPDEPDHKHADHRYYKVQFHELIARVPPIVNASKRSFSFIFTTWDRFVKAKTIVDLYRDDDYFVDRIYHALRDARLRPERYWDTGQSRQDGYSECLRILCENGEVVVSSQPGDGVNVLMDGGQSDDEILEAIRRQISNQGGVVTLPTQTP